MAQPQHAQAPYLVGHIVKVDPDANRIFVTMNLCLDSNLSKEFLLATYAYEHYNLPCRVHFNDQMYPQIMGSFGDLGEQKWNESWKWACEVLQVNPDLREHVELYDRYVRPLNIAESHREGPYYMGGQGPSNNVQAGDGNGQGGR